MKSLITLCLLLITLAACTDSGDGTPGAQQKATTVIAAEVNEQTFDTTIEALGTAHANESVTISSNITEKIRSIHFRDGQTVDKGNLIVRLDDSAERAELKAAKSRLSERGQKLERSRGLYEKGILSRAEYDQALAEEAAASAEVQRLVSAIEDRNIKAPFSGRLGLREVSVGRLVEPGDQITTLDDLSVIKVDFMVPSANLSILQTGLAVVATNSAYPELQFKGSLDTIGTRVDPESRSIKARALIPNSDAILRPGMLMEMTLLAGSRKSLAIPESAVTPVSEDQFVYRIIDGKAQRARIEIGKRQEGMVEVLSGLKAGDTVIAHGAIKISDGTPVMAKAAESSITAPQ